MRLGNLEHDIFPLGLGTNTFSNPSEPAEYETVLDAFVAGGGNFLDTADQYAYWVPGNEGGESETIIGEWLRKRGGRDRIVIATKVAGLPARKGLEPGNVQAAIEDSLRRLQTDYIDLYYAHYDDPERPMEEIARTFDELVKSGKVREIGISNVEPDRIDEWMRIAGENNLATPVALQPQYSLVSRRNYEQKYAPLAEKYGLAVFPYYALASGFLTGKYRTKEDLNKSWRGQSVADYLNEDGLKVVDALQSIADARNTAVATVALAWLLAKPTIAAPLASATSTKQLDELLAVPALELTADEVAALDKVSETFA